MKTYLFFLMAVVCGVSAFMGCFWKKSRDDRMMDVARYVAANCEGSVMYDSLPSRYTGALLVGYDSADRFIAKMEGYVKRGECPE